MKKTINTLCVISVISIALLIIFSIIWEGKDPRHTFIFEWVSVVLTGLSIPLVLRGFSLFAKKDILRPKTWLIIYGCAFLSFVLLASGFGFIERTRDLYYVLNEQYSVVQGVVNSKSVKGSNLIVNVNDTILYIGQNQFERLEEQQLYDVYYLPNSKWVIEIASVNRP